MLPLLREGFIKLPPVRGILPNPLAQRTLPAWSVDEVALHAHELSQNRAALRQPSRSRVIAITPAVRPQPAPLSAVLLVQRIGAAFAGLPDARGQSNNPRYAMEDTVLSALAVFFSQSPSFLDG